MRNPVSRQFRYAHCQSNLIHVLEMHIRYVVKELVWIFFQNDIQIFSIQSLQICCEFF